MSGRAGRRGLDDTGVVIIACGGEEPPDVSNYHLHLCATGLQCLTCLVDYHTRDHDSRKADQAAIAVPADI